MLIFISSATSGSYAANGAKATPALTRVTVLEFVNLTFRSERVLFQDLYDICSNLRYVILKIDFLQWNVYVF